MAQPFLMPQKEAKAQPNKEKSKEKAMESLFNYEYEEDNDETDWTTKGLKLCT